MRTEKLTTHTLNFDHFHTVNPLINREAKEEILSKVSAKTNAGISILSYISCGQPLKNYASKNTS